MRKSTFITVMVWICVCSSSLKAQDKIPPRQIQFFEKKIRPVLVKHCYKCHSAKSEEIGGHLLLDSPQAIKKGGDSGPAVVPKNPKRSLLLSAIEYRDDLEMPPDQKLPDSVIADFRRWITMGAPDPRQESLPLKQKDTNPGQLWSLKPVVKHEPPQVSDESWPVTAIDRFVLAKLEQNNLSPAKDTDVFSLCRRLHIGLVGLPPRPAKIQQFVTNYQKDARAALESLVDELLASPQFGERWGRHWLDVARYAESNGKSRDVLFPHAWRYRNWVIDALNSDMPFTQFVKEQIAGDLLAAKSPEQRDRQRIATGLLAVGSKPISGGNLQFDIIDDQIDVVTRGFLGITASCARCHDHKFDPIPTADYYALAGIFNSTKTLYGGGARRPKGVADAAKVLMILGDDVPVRTKQAAEIAKRSDKIKKQRDAARKRLQNLQRGKNKNAPQVEAARKKLNDLEAEFAAVQKEIKQNKFELAMGVAESPKVADVAILVRGDKGKRGAVVPRGFLSCVSLQSPVKLDQKQSGRLQLAEWITRPDNPLSARVAANRIWHHLFGSGIVETVDNFGFNGKPPSHSELLDWLAQRFVDNGGSTKKLIREIVCSRVYRLSNEFNETAYSIDPENRLLWRASRRRLEAEAIRDGLLSAAGKLDLERPESSVVAQIGDGEVGRGINEQPLRAPFYHRGIYLPILRTAMIEILKTFDFPDPSNLQGRRDVTNVPTQSLFFMNNPLVIEMADALALTATEIHDDDRDRVAYVYLCCYGRQSADSEIDKSLDFITGIHEKMLAEEPSKKRQLEAWSSFCQALFASAEFRFVQ